MKITKTCAARAVRWIGIGLLAGLAQAPARAPNVKAGSGEAEALSRDWAAIAAGRPKEAVSIAD